MLATEISSRCLALIFAAAVMVLLSGCTPPGARALLRGDELLRAGQTAAAIPELKKATELLPEESRAWNLLGLAYHRAGQPQLAVQAYRQALAKDHSNLVSVAHFNIGCLLLEQNNPAAAADHLRSYTLITNSAPALLKLGSAQVQLRQLDAAERTFAAVLRVDPKNAEALNGVGVVHALRHQRDAWQYFSAALQSNPKHPPALLNSAIIAQQHPTTRAGALPRLREYLAVAPQSRHAEGVKLMVRQLESELAPRVVPTNVPQVAVTRSNPPPSSVRTSAPSLVVNTTPPPAISATSRVATVVTNVRPPTFETKTNAVVAAVTNIPPPEVVRPRTAPTNAVVANGNAPAAATNLAAVPSTNRPVVANVPVTVVTVTTAPPPIVVAAETPLQPENRPPGASERRVGTVNPPPAEELPAQRQAMANTAPITTPDISLETPADSEARKGGFLNRLNPFRGKPKVQETNDVPRQVVLRASPPSPEPTPAASYARYRYLAPTAPPAGNRNEAKRLHAEAVNAERARNTNDALRLYQRAIAADPSFFDARYNAALLAFNAGDLNRALGESEMALAIEPDSLNARFNFALALKQANHAVDAARELERVIELKPGEARAHLTLANLYAQQLNHVQKARAHYLKVLELEPRNPQAAAIRFWLAANP